MNNPEEEQPSPKRAKPMAIPVWLTAEELRQIQQQYETPIGKSGSLARDSRSQFPYSLHDPHLNSIILDPSRASSDSQQMSTLQINTLPVVTHTAESARMYKKRTPSKKKAAAGTNTSSTTGQEGLHMFGSMPSPANPPPKRNTKRRSKPAMDLGASQFPPPTPEESIMAGLKFGPYSTMGQRSGDCPYSLPFQMDNFQGDSDYGAVSSSDPSSSKPNSRRRKQRLSNLRDMPASELQFLSPTPGNGPPWKKLETFSAKNGQSDESAGLEELAKKLYQKQEAMELPSLVANPHPNDSVMATVNMEPKFLENGSSTDLAAIETAKASPSVENDFVQSSPATSIENLKSPIGPKPPKRVKFAKNLTTKEKVKTPKPRVTKPKGKAAKPRVPKEKSVKASAAPRGKSRASSSAGSSAGPKAKPSSTVTSASLNGASPLFMASPEKPHLSIPDLSKSPKRHAITLGRYDRRQHDTVTSEEDRTRCQYVDNYVCTNRIATPDSTYCMEHFLLAGKRHGISLSKIKKSVPICAFTFNSGGTPIKCRKPVSSFDSSFKFCKSHEHDIRSMKRKLMKLTEHKDYLDVLRHGCSVDLPNQPHTDSQNKQDNGPKTAEDSSQTENGEAKVDNSEAATGPETSSQTIPPKPATPVMLVAQQRFKVPGLGCVEMNKDEDDDGWLDYRTVTVKDVETLQLFQSDSDDNSEDDEELQGHEMLSTAGYHTTEELIRLLRDKLEALLLLYRKDREYSKEMYLMRRRYYLEELETTKKTKTVRESSNPDLLPCNEDFPSEFTANELIDRNNIRHLLRQGTTEGQLGLLIHKANEEAARNPDHFRGGKLGFSKLSSSSLSSAEPRPCSSKSIGKPMHRGGKKSVTNNSGNGKKNSGKAMSEKKLNKIKNSAKQAESLNLTEPEAPTISKCSSSGCTEKPLPLTKYCQEHITKDELQVMYISCGSLKTTTTTCETPVMDLMETKGCPIHFQEYLPDLPLSKEEKDYIMAEEDKQMILPDAEEKVIDNILLSQFVDVSHLEEELSEALKSDYLDTDSESEESADDEKRLPPFSDVIKQPDAEMENKEFDDSDEMLSDDSDGVEFVESDSDVDPFYGVVRTGQSLPK